MIVYHGTTKKFDHFDLAHLGEGEGEIKVWCRVLRQQCFDTAADKCKGETKYVYTLEVPELTDFNHIVSAKDEEAHKLAM